MKLIAANTLLLIAGASAFTTQTGLPKASFRSTSSLNVENLSQITPSPDEVVELMQSYGERSRKYRRSYFTAGDWVRSRRPDRFINNIATTFQSGLLRQLNIELPFILFASVFIDFYNILLVQGYDDLAGVHHDKIIDFTLPLLTIPLASLTLSASALGLLLAFRTNVSYQRWDEARKAWGKVINDSRSICRMACTWAKSYENIDDAALVRIGEATCTFSRTLQNRVLPPQEDEEDYRNYLETRVTDKKFAEKMKNAKHRPTAALAEITACTMDMNLNPLHQVEVEKVITGLCDALGASERIFTSPVPTFYPRHLARFLAFWLLALPLALYEPFSKSWNHWGMIPATFIISMFMLGIEELATQMEEPFSILPMEKMCEGSIRTPVMEQVERSIAAPALYADKPLNGVDVNGNLNGAVEEVNGVNGVNGVNNVKEEAVAVPTPTPVKVVASSSNTAPISDPNPPPFTGNLKYLVR